ncbi:MAG: hypothetical protein KJZ65_07580 [Phycisphaerales bacterium]|nr:hypothetical protein [Phycisphaerales bacterium]
MPRRLTNPVIVVPGITATHLRDEYRLPPESVWGVLSKAYERVVMHPDNTAYEAVQPARIEPGELFEVAYKELIAELRHDLPEKPDEVVPVFPFAYDWRQPLETTEAELAAFIDEVIGRTSLLRHYDAAGWTSEPKVNLVGHSMGGLVIAGCLDTLGAKARVGKVATLATPFRGSFEAVIKVITGTSDLGPGAPSSREREAARLTPALYYLIPSFQQGLDIEPDAGLPDSLFNADLWQSNVVDTIAQWIRTHGLHKKAPKAQASDLFSAMLGAAGKHRQRMERFKLERANLAPEDWLAVVGVDATTRVRLQVKRSKPKTGDPQFVLTGEDRRNYWGDKQVPPDQWRITGDGTVPFAGAIPPFLEERNLVCVVPDDFGYWEVGDKVFTRLAGFHGILPNMDMLHRMIVRHFTGRPDRHGNTWGRTAPGVAREDWKPAVGLGPPR